MEIRFQSRWLERCVRDYLGIEGRALTEEDVSVIRYLYVNTTNDYLVGLSKCVLSGKFAFSDTGFRGQCQSV